MSKPGFVVDSWEQCGRNLFTVHMASGARGRELDSGLYMEMENLSS